MSRLILGLRLAARAGMARITAVATCSALGMLLLLFCVDFPEVAHNAGFTARDDRIAYRLLTSIVALPVVVLIATTSRLSSDTRDRRLAALRLMGLPPRGAGVVAAGETGALVLAGGLVGVLAYAAVRHPVWVMAVNHGLGRRTPQSHLVRDIVILLCIVMAVSAVAAGPARRTGAVVLASARTSRWGRFTSVLATIGLVGLLTATVLAFLPTHEGSISTGRIPLLGFALICLVIGLLGLAAYVSAVLAKVLRRSSSPAAIIAAARTQSDRASLGRAFAGLGAATFAAAFGLSVFTIFTTTPQYKSADYWQHHKTATIAQPMHSQSKAETAAFENRLKRMPEVLSVSPARFIDNSGAGTYTGAMSLTCNQIREQARLKRCSDSQPWVANVSAADDGSNVGRDGDAVSAAKPAITAGRVSVDGKKLVVKPKFSEPVQLNDSTADSTMRSILSGRTLILPPAWLSAHGVRVDGYYILQRPGSRLVDKLSDAGDYQYAGMPDSFTWDQVQGYRNLAYLVIAVVMSVGLLTVVVSVLDLLAERRRRVASLRMMGIPAAALRSAQFLSTLVPMSVTVITTLVAGYCMGRAYLSFGGEPGATPTQALAFLLVVVLAAGVLLAAATTSGLGRPLTAGMIRRE